MEYNATIREVPSSLLFFQTEWADGLCCHPDLCMVLEQADAQLSSLLSFSGLQELGRPEECE